MKSLYHVCWGRKWRVRSPLPFPHTPQPSTVNADFLTIVLLPVVDEFHVLGDVLLEGEHLDAQRALERLAQFNLIIKKEWWTLAHILGTYFLKEQMLFWPSAEAKWPCNFFFPNYYLNNFLWCGVEIFDASRKRWWMNDWRLTWCE